MKTLKRIDVSGAYGILYLGSAEFYFDIEDLDLIRNRDWYQDKDGYLVCSYLYAGKRQFVRFHRIVMKAKPSQIVDHINNNRADNRKENLRCCSRAENNRNRKRYATNTSGVSGVYYDKRRRKWVASITYQHKRLNLGRFKDKDDAIAIRLKIEAELFREFAPQSHIMDERMECVR